MKCEFCWEKKKPKRIALWCFFILILCNIRITRVLENFEFLKSQSILTGSYFSEVCALPLKEYANPMEKSFEQSLREEVQVSTKPSRL